MSETQILSALRLLPFITAVLFFGLLCQMYLAYHPGRLILKTWRELSGLLRRREQESSWYSKTQEWLARNGGPFHYGKRIEPWRYLAARMVLALLGLTIVSSVSWESGIAAAAMLYFLPAGLLMYLNGKDNDRLLPELKLVYHALEIQIKAGVYMTDALSECYSSVQEPRLREALLELAGDIVMKADIYQALDRFQRKFDNRYVDSLCITLMQALESGQALELLGDIGEQIKDVEANVLERKKNTLDRSITFYQLGVLAVVLGIALYACVTYMFGTAMRF